MKTIKGIIALSLLAVLLCSAAAFAESMPYFRPESNLKTVWRCQHCGKVAEGNWGKMTAGSCTHFFHDWKITELNPSDYKKQMEETERKKQQEFQQWHWGHMQGWW